MIVYIYHNFSSHILILAVQGKQRCGIDFSAPWAPRIKIQIFRVNRCRARLKNGKSHKHERSC